MTQNGLLLLSLILILLSLGLWWWTRRARVRQRVDERLGQSLRRRSRGDRLLSQGQDMWRRRSRQRKPLAELPLLLRQAGCIGHRAQLIGLLQMVLIWLGIVGLTLGWSLGRDNELGETVVMLFLAGCGGALGLLRWLRFRVVARAARIDEEMLLVLQVLRILWDVGMSIETMLRTLTRELEVLAPEAVKELRVVLAKIESGGAREQALADIARLSTSEGFQDLMTLLTQVSETGGGMSSSLEALAELLQDRRRTGLQERVSKLSGRMSAVMMLLMFPALLLVLAGPGFLALVKALENVG
ncbi:type II secretion system F family protein [Marinobacterium aestuarii]|nr:type II secretion system F family protein [Marinobacterium aestuarii]